MKDLIACGKRVEVCYLCADGGIISLLQGEIQKILDVSDSFPQVRGKVYGVCFAQKIPATHFPTPHPDFAHLILFDESVNVATYVDSNKQPRSVRIFAL